MTPERQANRPASSPCVCYVSPVTSVFFCDYSALGLNDRDLSLEEQYQEKGGKSLNFVSSV